MKAFHTTTRGLIRGVKKVINQIKGADARASVKAQAKGDIPLLFANTQAVSDGLDSVLARCDSALAQLK